MFDRKALLPIDIVSCQKDPDVLVGHLAEEDDSEVIEHFTTDCLEMLSKRERTSRRHKKSKRNSMTENMHSIMLFLQGKVSKKDFRRRELERRWMHTMLATPPPKPK